jgi:hypothetical protein
LKFTQRRERDYLRATALGDPLGGGVKTKNRSAALRASFFAPVRFGKLARCSTKWFLFNNLFEAALATLPETKNAPLWGCTSILCFAEREGFEPPEAFTSTVFKTAAFDRSAISPGAK